MDSASAKKLFPDKKSWLLKHQHSPSHSWVAQLHPFIDKNEFLRVGGWLQNLSKPQWQQGSEASILFFKSTPFYATSNFRRPQASHARRSNGDGARHTRTLLGTASSTSGKESNQRIPDMHPSLLETNRAPCPRLPAFRVKNMRFLKTAWLDFAGPLYAKMSKDSDSKIYIVLFTCAATRALYLEFVSDMSSPTFLLAFRCFIARRRLPIPI